MPVLIKTIMKIILIFLAFIVLSVNAASQNKVTGRIMYGSVKGGLPILFVGPHARCPQNPKAMKYYHFNIVSFISITYSKVGYFHFVQVMIFFFVRSVEHSKILCMGSCWHRQQKVMI